MRLLTDQGNGRLKLAQFWDVEIPRYAILSHTWGDSQDEVQLSDFAQDESKNKPGYRKIEFCRDQATKDGLEYFWIDTCCIDKSSSAELSDAINSMFSWYQNASECYVYLSDVSASTSTDTPKSRHKWKQAFQESKWFRRGWTLQELIAPVSVTFFSREGIVLGTKRSLEGQIHEITGIPLDILRGNSLARLSFRDRLSWARGRTTKLPEDLAYSLLGIFGIQMPLLYGEGKDRAFARLQREFEKAGRLIPTDSLSYQPLEEAGFRVFVLEPESIGQKIVGHLLQSSLPDPPPYYALSYVWGTEPTIFGGSIDGHVKFIQPNLYQALQRLRSRTTQLNIWVDYLCINQLDQSERNLQVRQMANIFHQASGVLIWLGEDDSISKFAMSLVTEIIGPDFRWDGEWWARYDFAALAQLLERPWFRRGWVLQEAAYSKNSVIHCGDRSIHMDDFVMAIDYIRARLSTIPPSFSQEMTAMHTATFFNFDELAAVRLLDTMEGSLSRSDNGGILYRKFSLETLVDLSTFSETTDQRDTIFALLNLASDTNSILRPDELEVIDADYGKDVMEVFVDFILHCCNRSGSLDIICRPWAPIPSATSHSLTQNNQTRHNLRVYPSWIACKDKLSFGNPALRFNHRLHGKSFVGGSQKQIYNAHYGSKPQVIVERNEDGTCAGSISVKGLVLGKIVQRSTRLAGAIVTKDCLKILGEISQKPHSSVVDLPDTIWRTLCADRNDKGDPAPRYYRVAMLQLLQLSAEGADLNNAANLIDLMSNIDIEELLETNIPDHVREFLTVIRDVVWNRRTFRLEASNFIQRPLVGLAPQKAIIGDIICILYGCSVPVVLRRMGSSSDTPCWQLIGEVYVHGVMEGEIIQYTPVKTLQEEEVDFRIF